MTFVLIYSQRHGQRGNGKIEDVLVKRKPIANACFGPTEKREDVSPYTWYALHSVRNSFRAVEPALGLPFQRVRTPERLRPVDDKNGDEDTVAFANPVTC
jgi:hypothetical protein